MTAGSGRCGVRARGNVRTPGSPTSSERLCIFGMGCRRSAAGTRRSPPTAHGCPQALHVGELTEDKVLSDIDRLSRQYTGTSCPQRDRRRFSAWIDVDSWYGWGTLKDSGQPG